MNRLKDIKKQYDENFDLLMVAVKNGDVGLHDTLVEEERRLNRLDVQVRKELGIWAKDPCPQVKVECWVCEQKNGGCRVLQRGGYGVQA